MNFNQLRYFVSVAETKSFTKAAEKHFISQTAISQQIQALEESLGCQLLDRTTRPVSLTPPGAVFLLEAEAVLERMDRAVARTTDAASGIVGTLKIGYKRGYERSNLSGKMKLLHDKYPNILISCFRHSSDELASGLMNGAFDMIFTWDSTNLKEEPGTEYRLMEKAHLVVALCSAHPFAQRERLLRMDLRNETILYMTPSAAPESFGDAHFLEMYQRAGFQPNILMRSSDPESILMMVAAGEGVSVLPDYCTKKLTSAENLVFVPLEGEEEFEEICAIWRSDNDNPAIGRMLELL